MNHSPYKTSLNFKLLIPIIVGVLALHLAGFYKLKSITFLSQNLITPKLSHLGDDPLISQEHLLKKRNEDLTNIFNRLLAKTVAPTNVQFDFQDLNRTLIPGSEPEIDPSSPPMPKESLQESSKEAFQNFIETAKNTSPSLLSNSSDLLESSFQYSEEAISDTANPVDPTFELATAHAIHHPISLIDLCENCSSTTSLDLPLSPIGLNEPILPSSNMNASVDPANNTQRIIANSSDFMVHVEYAPRLKEEGFIFKLSLLPKPHKQFKRIRQNFFFLLDRSHSISHKQYELAKEAVAKVLDLMHEEDTFNLFVFDGKVVKLSETNLPLNPKNRALAKSFLKAQKHGGFFATTDLYSSLDKIIPEAVQDNEVNTAILLSDGDTFLNKEKQRKTLNQWTQKNRGKVSLFSIAIGKRNNVPLLDLLSIFNKGSIRVAVNASQITGELTHLIQSLNSPIGKDLVATVLPHHTHAKVTLYPSVSRMPNLYENLEYVLYGSIDKASDFTLFLQGRYYDNWLDIKKTISLTKGILTDESCLKKNLLLQQAYQEYEQFLHTGHPEFLTKAKELLKPIQLPLAFE